MKILKQFPLPLISMIYNFYILSYKLLVLYVNLSSVSYYMTYFINIEYYYKKTFIFILNFYLPKWFRETD